MAGASQSSGNALDMLKNMSMKAGTYIKDASVKTADAVSEGTKNIRNSKFATSTAETASQLGTRAAEGGSYLYNVTKTTTEGVVGRFAAAGLTAECAREAKEAPCPRMMIICCTALCSSGLVHEGLFTDSSEAETGAAMLRDMRACHYSRLPDTSATPQVIAQALKLWLFSLAPEPLLTFKLVPALTSPDTTRESLRVVLAELPPPNRAALFMLLETCGRIAGNAAINATDAKALATALAPCLLWREPDPESKATAGAEQEAPEINPLTAEEEAVFIRLLTYMVTNHRMLEEKWA